MHSQEEIRQINAMLKSQLPFIGAAALSRPGWDAEDFIESFAKDWGIELEVLPDERGSLLLRRCRAPEWSSM